MPHQQAISYSEMEKYHKPNMEAFRQLEQNVAKHFNLPQVKGGITHELLGALQAVMDNVPKAKDTMLTAAARSIMGPGSRSINNGNWYDQQDPGVLNGYSKARGIKGAALDLVTKPAEAAEAIAEKAEIARSALAKSSMAASAGRAAGMSLRALGPVGAISSGLHVLNDINDRYKLAEQLAAQGKIPPESLKDYKEAIMPAEAALTLTGGIQSGYGSNEFHQWADKYGIKDQEIRQKLDPSGVSNPQTASLSPSSAPPPPGMARRGNHKALSNAAAVQVASLSTDKPPALPTPSPVSCNQPAGQRKAFGKASHSPMIG